MSLAGRGTPRVSVIISAWNASATIERAVTSVLDQHGVDLECVVVDDGSTDDTAAVLRRQEEADPRLIVDRLAVNGGVSVARNRALELASGEWLAFLDADDRLIAGGLGALVGHAEATDPLIVVGQRISTDGERTWFPTLYDFPDIREAGRKSLERNPDLLYYVGPAGKLFHSSVATGLRFEGRMMGDQPWVVQALVRAGDRIEVIEDVVYEWRRPHPDRYVPTITSARERSARLGTEAARMAAVAFDTASRAFADAYDPPTATHLEALYLRRLLRADLSVQFHHAVERRDPDLAPLILALRDLIANAPPAAVKGADPSVRVELIEPLSRQMYSLPAPARRAFLDLAVACARVDRETIRSFRSRSQRWPLRIAAVPVVGPPLAYATLSAWASRLAAHPTARPGD